MGELIHADFGRDPDTEWVTKRHLADQVGRSTRWVELRMREGLPSTLERRRRRYQLTEALAWIAEYEGEKSPPDEPQSDQPSEDDQEPPEDDDSPPRSAA